MLQRLEALRGRPHVVRHDRDEVIQDNDLSHSPRLPCGSLIETPYPSAKYGTGGEGRELHVRRQHIDAVDEFAVHFFGRIESLQGLADQPERVHRLQRWVLGGRDSRRSADQRLICNSATRGRMNDFTRFGPAGRRIDFPPLGGGFYQNGAGTAPALRSGIQNARIELEFPVT